MDSLFGLNRGHRKYWMRHCLRILCVCICMFWAACSDGGDSGDGPDDGLVPPALSLAWPADPPRSAKASPHSFGAADVAGLSPGSQQNGAALEIRSGSDDFGWATFALQLSGDELPASVNVSDFSLPAGQRAWLAVGNWSTLKWEWRAPFERGQLPVWSLDPHAAFRSPNARLYLALAVERDGQLDFLGGSFTTYAPSDELGFPRLGMWYADPYKSSLADCARYDVHIGDYNYLVPTGQGDKPFGTALKDLNPGIVLLTYTAFSEINYLQDFDGLGTNPYLPAWPAGWLLTEAGTTLSSAINASATSISVSDWEQSGPVHDGQSSPWEIFHVDGDVQVGQEIMTVTGLNPGAMTLTVTRGAYGSSAAAHSGGERIAPIARYWPGTYVTNLTPSSPLASLDGASGPESFWQYYLRMSASGVDQSGGWFDNLSNVRDGLLLDRMEDTQSWLAGEVVNSIDHDRDNVADDFAAFDSAWLSGIESITTALNSQYPGKPVLRNNGGGRRFGDYNGNNFESFPRDEWNDSGNDPAAEWHYNMFGAPDEDFGGLVEWATLSPQPNYTWLETYEDDNPADPNGDGSYDNPFDKPGFKPNYRKMRFGLCSALVAGSYFSYEINTNGHGSLGLMWFDEYDDSGRERGWLGQPVAAPLQLWVDPNDDAQGVWAREYEHGLALVNPYPSAKSITLPAGQWQRLSGSQQPQINNGEIARGELALPAQDGLLLKRSE
ncbi:hypothetical protein IT575_14675 [bacterium]|nr:hypothetical protein [bacterium]